MGGRGTCWGATTTRSLMAQVFFFTEMCSGFEKASYLRLIDLCITQS